MGIEQDIKQEKFTSEYQKLFINLAYTNSFLHSILLGYLKPYDLSMQQFNVLRILRGQHPNPVSINSITERMIDKMSNASRLVEKLHKKEMISRKTCQSDRRQVDVGITDLGLQILKELDEIMPKFESIFTHMDKSELKQMNSLLDKLRKPSK